MYKRDQWMFGRRICWRIWSLENLEYEIVEEFLADLKKEFGGENKEAVKVVELNKLEQGERTMEEFV